MSENKPEYVTDALEMIGNGYDQPAVEIEHPRRISSRKARGEFEERTTPAWVKFSTAFKEELPDIDGNALKVWIFIALSVDYKGEAFPAIQTIAKSIGLSHTTVIQCIKDLEFIGILTVRRGERRFNIYEITDDYVKIGKGEPVKKVESSAPTSKENGLINKENTPTSKDVLTLTRVNQIQQENKQRIAKSSPEWAMLSGVDITPEMAGEWEIVHEAQVEFETALGVSNPLQWDKDRDWDRFSRWVVARYVEDKDCFKKYQVWRATPYVKGAIANTRLRGFVNEFYDSWDMFKMSDKSQPSDNGRSINTLTRDI